MLCIICIVCSIVFHCMHLLIVVSIVGCLHPETQASGVSCSVVPSEAVNSCNCGRSQAGPVSACTKVLRSVHEADQSGNDKSAGVLLVQAETSAMVSLQTSTSTWTFVNSLPSKLLVASGFWCFLEAESCRNSSRLYFSIFWSRLFWKLYEAA